MVNKMVIFKLLEETENTAIYEYFPENEDKFGKVSINKLTGEPSIILPAENDRHRKYACKVIRRLIEFQKNNKYEKSGLVAWY